MISADIQEINVEVETNTSNIETDTLNVEIEVNNIEAEIDSNVEPLEINDDVLRIVETKYEKDHSQLENLDYESSGHTGFQKKGNYVEDKRYVHTDNNFSNDYKEKLDNLICFIPQTSISTFTEEGVKYLKISWEINDLFYKYIMQGRVKLHLYKYTKSGTKRWKAGEDNYYYKHGAKKWIHPANKFYPNNPSKQCWGIRSFQANKFCETDIDKLIDNSEYDIANDGFVKSEYSISSSMQELAIPLNDIISPILKIANTSYNQVILPTTGDDQEVKLMGVRQKAEGSRCNQPIKFCLVVDDKYVGSCLNTAVLQLFKYRTTQDNHNKHGFENCYSVLPDIGYSVYIK